MEFIISNCKKNIKAKDYRKIRDIEKGNFHYHKTK